MAVSVNLDTGQIKTWRSIVTLIVFVITNVIVINPQRIPVYVPRPLWNAILDTLGFLRIISRTPSDSEHESQQGDMTRWRANFRRLELPLNFVTMPLISDLFLLAILAIGRDEVKAGTLGADNIVPIDIMAFFLTLAYIAISIDASGLIRYLAFKVLQWGGDVGHKLFLYLYAFFFGIGSFIGNDPIILSGTAFLAYMTRVSRNIKNPRAWIHTQFAVANIASAILVSSNPTNLVLAGAFNIKFINYTANIIVPVVVTSVVLFPFLLYVVFADSDLIPVSIKMYELPDEVKDKKPVNPNIPQARGNTAVEEDKPVDGQQPTLTSLEEVLNPFLDKGGALVGAAIMATTLITLLALNAASQSGHERPVFWVTLPAAFLMFCWDVGYGWWHRAETREIARTRQRELEDAQAKHAMEQLETTFEQENGIVAAPEDLARTDVSSAEDQQSQGGKPGENGKSDTHDKDADDDSTLAQTSAEKRPPEHLAPPVSTLPASENGDSPTPAPTPWQSSSAMLAQEDHQPHNSQLSANPAAPLDEKHEATVADSTYQPQRLSDRTLSGGSDEEKQVRAVDTCNPLSKSGKPTLESLLKDGYRWLQETFPTVTAVVAHLPFALVPFAFSMFVLVQALVTKGWVPVFAYGWDHWVNKTGTVGAIGGMGFLSVILCNFAGTNIGTTILLSRVIQNWQGIHDANQLPISDRTFWATVYSMALGVNFGAFSTVFSASLAGLLWRDILARKFITVRSLEFARVNLPIIAVAMTVGCAVLTGEIYIIRGTGPYNA